MNKNKFKRILKDIVPPLISKGIIKALDNYRFISIDKYLNRSFKSNIDFHNIHKGRRCFILGCGPSINEQNLLPLKNELCISVSQFYLHQHFAQIKPAYHMHAPNHPPFDRTDMEKIIFGQNKIFENHKPICFYGHRKYEHSLYNCFKNLNILHDPQIRFINYWHNVTINESNYLKKDLWDISKMPFQPNTVIFCAIQLAVYMGIQTIYLLGCDHDYLVDLKRTIGIHFYNEKAGLDDNKNLKQFNSERFFEEYYTRWKRYRLMRQYADLNCMKIFNATKGGMLDVFDRIEFDKLF